jgi:hypothetical protein
MRQQECIRRSDQICNDQDGPSKFESSELVDDGATLEDLIMAEV